MSQPHDESDPTDPSDGDENCTPGQEATKLEQWRTYVQTTLNVSNRRLKNNRFYQTLFTATVSGVGIGVTLGVVTPVILLVVGLVGVVLSLLWMAHIISYKQLNRGKYTVLEDMAEDLPYSPFKEEWNVLDRGWNPETYVTHTSVEIWWPRVTLWVFGMLATYGGVAKVWAHDPAVVATVSWSVLMFIYGVAAFLGWKPFEIIAPYWKQRANGGGENKRDNGEDEE